LSGGERGVQLQDCGASLIISAWRSNRPDRDIDDFIGNVHLAPQAPERPWLSDADVCAELREMVTGGRDIHLQGSASHRPFQTPSCSSTDLPSKLHR
jgi:hypothetical protein